MNTEHALNKEDAKKRILLAAMEKFADRGFGPTSVREICEAAGVNVAAVNYYFRSKEQLYHEVFKTLFEDVGAPLMAIPAKVHDQASWKAALMEWIMTALRLVTEEKPPTRWMVQLTAHERTHPSSMFPVLYESFFKPLRESLGMLLRMGMPAGTDETDTCIWEITVASQVVVYTHRAPPWYALLIPPDVPREEWIERTARIIAGGITSRLAYQTGLS
ncbi:MAG TPA: CerR family C-terminal domain-containing protein [Kiritimatiellia bacterium]|nr:CerR family C-terminal domain-containing protein [Kiritimatiellia bacterium]HRZ12881.1 CerR family C-terminal domain-containing protein [Kiritimatiellia bacterium]HSA19459.1 CerR family C-terminal domain-containing protein [Kiritimatiellia bacterium]